MTVDEFTQKTDATKYAVIWARVSTGGQAETSIPTQVDAAGKKAAEMAYTIIQIFRDTYCSLDLYASEQFQGMRRLVVSGKISAIFIYDRDRLEAKGIQRLTFLTDCKEYGVQVFCVYGSAIDVDTPEGQIVEMALAIGKERQVNRARTGARDGLRDRVQKRKLPANHHHIKGYDWVLGNPKANPPTYDRLTPNKDYPLCKELADRLREGVSAPAIIKEYADKGIIIPESMIYRLAHNLTYAGQYHGLQTTSIHESRKERESKKRKGKVKAKIVPVSIENQTYLPEVIVESPLFTLEERQAILNSFAPHSRNSSRNAKHFYVLKDRIFSNELTNKKGEPQVYHGYFKHGRHQYRCPKKVSVNRIFDQDDIYPYVQTEVLHMVKVLKKGKTNSKSSENLNEILDKQLRKISEDKMIYQHRLARNEEVRFDAEQTGKTFDLEIYNIIKGENTHKLDQAKGKEEALMQQKSALANQELATAEMLTFFERFGLTDLNSKPNDTEWMELFDAINLRVMVNDKITRDMLTRLNAPDSKGFCGRIDIKIEVGVPVPSCTFWYKDGNKFEVMPITRPRLTPEMEEKLDTIDARSIDFSKAGFR